MARFSSGVSPLRRVFFFRHTDLRDCQLLFAGRIPPIAVADRSRRECRNFRTIFGGSFFLADLLGEFLVQSDEFAAFLEKEVEFAVELMQFVVEHNLFLLQQLVLGIERENQFH